MMRNARLLIAAAVFAAFSAAAAFSFDFGGSLDNTSSVSTTPADSTLAFGQSDTLAVWLQAPLGTAARLFLQGSYTFTLDRPYLFDLDQAYLQATATNVSGGPARFTFLLGRSSISDMTGYILNTPLDGISMQFGYPAAQLSVNVGYTGLLLKPSSNVIMSAVDANAVNDSNIYLGSPRIVGDFELNLPELFARQTLSLAVIFQQDMHASDKLVAEGTETLQPSGGGALNTKYFGLQIGGPIAPGFYYGVYSYLSTGTTLSYVADSASSTGNSYQYKPILAYLAGLDVSYFPENLLQSRILVRAVYSSGDSDSSGYYGGNTAGNSTTFRPISQSQFGLIFSPQLGNSANAELNFSLKPLSGLQINALKSLVAEVKGVTYFRTAFNSSGTGAPVSESGLLPGSKAAYLGTELDGTIRAYPFSDLEVSLSGGAFLPNVNATTPTDGAFPAGTSTAFLIQLGVSLTF